MKQFKLLILTDHSNHSAENSLYPFIHAMRNHPFCEHLDVATRGNTANHSFFKEQQATHIQVTTPTQDFGFDKQGASFFENEKKQATAIYDLIWLRLPPPLSESFLLFLKKAFPNQLIINDPTGIYTTGSKEFLVNFPELCPPMKVCKTVEDIIAFKNKFPIVLKPFREYGGKGIVRIDGNRVWEGKQESTFDHFIEKIKQTNIDYLGVKFLKNVAQGDKRIVVVNGKIMGASLRLPPPNSWICNVSMGGTSTLTSVSDEEVHIVKTIDPTLSKMGIVMYGVDTLVGDDGKRILSEINTTSIGGLPQIAKQKNEPLVETAADLIWNYFLKHKQ